MFTNIFCIKTKIILKIIYNSLDKSTTINLQYIDLDIKINIIFKFKISFS